MSYQLAARETDDFIDVGHRPSDDAFAPLIGRSSAIRQAVQLARRVSARGAGTVLIMGETGTGKEVFARAIHNGGPNRNAPFVAVNCAAIPAQLLEAELFGYERGAFTDARQKKQGLLELARDGTLFLDEVSSLPFDLQPKLLRALEERRVRRVGGFDEIEVRCRVTAATNVTLEQLVDEGAFREDLFYRLNVLRVSVPPLRERGGDVRVLAEHILSELADAQGLPNVRMTEEAVRALDAHAWPGNVRELKNVLERALLMSDAREIRVDSLGMGTRAPSLEPAPVLEDDAADDALIRVPAEGRSLKSVEAELVGLTLRSTGGNKSAAARALGISRPTLHRKIAEYGITDS
ncbi:MAG TPA: sigma-54 dependent transcriptional regulator [Longimicrobiales bacterium]|nr:sigma-54 dependent transcriptional regulator [Longimicrobiales bacterium]